jgi:hypothetical protein
VLAWLAGSRNKESGVFAWARKRCWENSQFLQILKPEASTWEDRNPVGAQGFMAKRKHYREDQVSSFVSLGTEGLRPSARLLGNRFAPKGGSP